MADKVPVRLDDKLSANKFNVDEEISHIEVNKSYPDLEECKRLVKICPAGLYKFDDTGVFRFDYVGCLECGTCRVLSGSKAVTDWKYPRGTYGVSFRFG